MPAICLFGGTGCHRTSGRDDLDLHLDQLLRHDGDLLGLPLGYAAFIHNEVAAFDVTQFAEPLVKRFPQWAGFENPDSVDPPRRLPLGGERRGEEGEGHAGDKGSPVHHSIT